MQDALPHSIVLLKIIAERLKIHQRFLMKKSEERQVFEGIIRSFGNIDENQRFLQSKECIDFTQVLMLAGLSMFGGVFIPILSSIVEKDDMVKITWDSGVSDVFTWGVYDNNFKRFASYYQDKLSSKPQFKKHIPASIFAGIAGFIISYQLILKAIDQRMKTLIQHKTAFIDLFKKDMSKDLLFIAISCLPTDQINALFLHIQEFFPKDLEVKTPDNRKMNVCSLFEKPSVDIHFLIEKIKMFCELYFTTKMPIIKEITQIKTVNYIKKIFQNDDIYLSVQQQLKRLKSSQVDPRLMIYDVLKTYLESLKVA